MSQSDISVIIGTFGDIYEWGPLAMRAWFSAQKQTLGAASIDHVHRDTLAEARNDGAERAEGQWLCFLDADDELDPLYLENMQRAIDAHAATTAWGVNVAPYMLLQPATLGINDENGAWDPFPVVIEKRPILDRNYMVIGTVVNREQFLRVGGFHEWEIYEDWDVWIRCLLDGATHVVVDDAIYRVHVRPNTRNQADARMQVRIFNAIRNQYLHHPNKAALR